MSTAQPPSDGDRPAEGQEVAPGAAASEAAPPPAPKRAPAKRTPRTSTTADAASAGTPAATGAARPTAARGTAARGTAAKKPEDAELPAKRTPAPRKRSTAKTTMPPAGEAPEILDAMLGKATPTADTSSSPVEPIPSEVPLDGADDATVTTTDTTAQTAVLPTASEFYAAPPTTQAAAPEVPAAPEPAPAAVAVPAPPAEAVPAAVPATPVPAAVPATPELATPAAEPVPSALPDAPVPAAGAAALPAPGADPTRADETAADPASDTSDTTTPYAAGPGIPGRAPGGAGPGTPDAPYATGGAGYRSVNDIADRLDDSRFFSSLFDFTFTSYVTRRLAGPVYVVGLVLIGLGIVVGFANSLGIAVATNSPAGAFVFLLGVLVTLVAAILSVLLLRVTIEVFCAIIEIAQNTRGRRRPPR